MPRMTTPLPPMAPPPLPTVLPPSPMTVGQALSSTLQILKRRFGFFVALALVPGLLVGLLFTVAFALGGSAVIGSLMGLSSGRLPSGGQVAGALLLGAGLAALGLLTAAPLVGLFGASGEVGGDGEGFNLASGRIQALRCAICVRLPCLCVLFEQLRL